MTDLGVRELDGKEAGAATVVPARTPIIIRHYGLGRVSDQAALEVLGSLTGLAGLPRDEVVDTHSFTADVDGGSWARSDNYLAHRAAEIRRVIAETPNARVLYLGAMPEVPHAIALGAYLGDEFPVEVFDSHRDAVGSENRWQWPHTDQTLRLETSGVPQERSNAAGPAVVRVEISASIDDGEVGNLVGPNDVAHIRIRPRATDTPTVEKRVRSPADVTVVRQAVRDALASIVEYRPNVDTIHLFVAAPVSVTFAIGQELRLRNTPPVQTYRFRWLGDRGRIRPAIRLTAAGPAPEDVPLTDEERAHAGNLRRDLWEAAVQDVERYAERKRLEGTSGERWYARLEPRSELARVHPFPTLPPIYEMIDVGATVDPVPLSPPTFYGYDRGNRRWRVSDQFLLGLIRTFDGNLQDARALLRLFLFHESLHVAHGITKAKVEEVGKFANGLEHVDYMADLYAVLHELDRAFQDEQAQPPDFNAFRHHTVYLIDLLIRSLWAFEDRPPLDRMEVRRIRRYFNWYWQCERVIRSRTRLQLALVLARKPVVEIAGLEPQVEGRRYYGQLRRFDPNVGLELGIVLDNEELWRIPHQVTVPLDKLMAAFSDHDHAAVQQAFRQIFDNVETSKHALPQDQDAV